jgi:hypothetical protein
MVHDHCDHALRRQERVGGRSEGERVWKEGRREKEWMEGESDDI